MMKGILGNQERLIGSALFPPSVFRSVDYFCVLDAWFVLPWILISFYDHARSSDPYQVRVEEFQHELDRFAIVLMTC